MKKCLIYPNESCSLTLCCSAFLFRFLFFWKFNKMNESCMRCVCCNMLWIYLPSDWKTSIFLFAFLIRCFVCWCLPNCIVYRTAYIYLRKKKLFSNQKYTTNELWAYFLLCMHIRSILLSSFSLHFFFVRVSGHLFFLFSLFLFLPSWKAKKSIETKRKQ